MTNAQCDNCVAPHIPTCLQNLYSTHEDVEIGRCVQKFAGIPCTWNYEMQYIMKHNSSGKTAFTRNLKRKDVNNAISLHPVKQAPLMYRLHTYLQGLKAEDLRQETLYLHRDIIKMAKLLSINSNNYNNLVPDVHLYPVLEGGDCVQDHTVLGISPDLNKYFPTVSQNILNWEFVAKSLYSVDNANSKRKIESSIREGLENVVLEIMDHINNFSRQRGRIIEFRELLYGYSRLNHIHGQDLILDLLLIYKKYRGKKMTVPVRRHLYIQRSFTSIFVKEFNENFFRLIKYDIKYSKISNKLKKMINTGFEKISNSLPGFQIKGNEKAQIAFVLPIMGRIDSYINFLRIYENVAINSDQNSNLLVIMFGNDEELQKHIQRLIELKEKYPYEKINYIRLTGEFSRGLGLDKAVRSPYIKNEDILFFVDVDISFDKISLDRIRINTIRGNQLYLPIVFSEYDKNRRKCFKNNSSSNISNMKGFFRQFGFGICSIFKSDLVNSDNIGFDIDIKGWGLEDVRFLEKIIASSNKQGPGIKNTAEFAINLQILNDSLKRNLQVFRSPDPSLVHVYHEINCDVNLELLQFNMCIGTKANILGTTNFIERIFLNNEKNVRYINIP